MEKRYIATQEMAGNRLDRCAAAVWDVSRTAVQHWLEAGLVSVNGVPAHKKHTIRCGDEIKATIPDAVPASVCAQNIPLDIVYEDSVMLVVNKPRGMVVHPAAGHASGTLVNALLAHCAGQLSGINGVMRPGIVHRLDKDTSGLLMVAKTDSSHRSLARQIQDHSFLREYQTVVIGHLKQLHGTVDAPIGRHPVRRKQMAVVRDGRPARTHFEVLAEYPGYSRLRVRLETGRTHQIRVHMAHLGHPVAGDTVYGSEKRPPLSGGQCLHAQALGFRHPESNQFLSLTAPLPDYFCQFIRSIDR